VFGLIESRVREPMLPLGLFKNRTFAGAQLGVFAISGSFFAIFLYTTLYLQNVLGLSAVESGLVYMPGTLIMFFVSGASAQLLNKVSARAMVSVGLALVAAGMLLLTVLQVDSHWWVFLPGEIVALIGTGMFNPAISGVALSALPERQSGLAAGAHDTFRQGGIAVGIAALGALVPAQAALGHGDAQAFVDGLRNALIVGAGLAALGAVGTATLLRTRRTGAAQGTELALEQA